MGTATAITSFNLTGAASVRLTAPSGREYQVKRGDIFQVGIAKDVEFFRADQRFSEVRFEKGVGAAIPAQPKPLSYLNLGAESEEAPPSSPSPVEPQKAPELPAEETKKEDAGFVCKYCGKSLKNKAGLSAHIRAKHFDEEYEV